MIDKHKELTVTLASNEELTDMSKYYKTKKAFEQHYFGGKPTKIQNNVYHHSITIVKLIK